MYDQDKDFQAAHEVGKIYNSFMDKGVLCDFFLESSLNFINASDGFLFLSGGDDKIWMESKAGSGMDAPSKVQEEPP